MLMKSNGDSSLFSLLSRKSMIDPQSILKISHRNRFYKCSNEVSTQSIPLTNDEQTQISNSNQSKDLQISPNKFHFVNPFALIDRVEHGEIFLKFVHKQNSKIDAIFSQFLQSLQKTADDFLLALQQENSLYGIYRRDLIWFLFDFSSKKTIVESKCFVFFALRGTSRFYKISLTINGSK